MKSVFINENVFNLSDPQPSWMFNVTFFNNLDSNFSYIDQSKLIAESITLPSYETELVTKKYFGSERTYPVVRTYGTDIEMIFTLRTENSDNLPFYELSQMNARHKTYSIYANSIKYPVHPEHEKYNEQVSSWKYYNVDKIEVDMIDKLGNITHTYTFDNCVLKSFSFDSSLDYTNDTYLRAKLVYHSDIWSFSKFNKQ